MSAKAQAKGGANDMNQVTIVGGGLAGLVAAITAAEEGATVVLLEAHDELGGRARSATYHPSTETGTGTTAEDGGFVANFGPHALYKGRSNWRWLKQRGLLPATVTPPSRGVRFFYDGRAHRTPPAGMLRALPSLLLGRAPVERDFRSWATAHAGKRNADSLCAYSGVIAFHHDPGSLSAAFVAERLRWVYLPPSIRFVKGGWNNLIAPLHERAVELGVTIQTATRVTELPEPPVIVATELHQARTLLDDETLQQEGGTVALLDLGLRSQAGEPGAIVDLEQGALIERYSSCDDTVAPPGCEILQCHIGIAASEHAYEGIARIEDLLDATFPKWRERVLWRRRQIAQNRSGAVDPPGHTWQNRPTIDRGNGIYLAGDMLAAPGYLSEASFTSAQQAALAAADWQPTSVPTQPDAPPSHVRSG